MTYVNKYDSLFKKLYVYSSYLLSHLAFADD
jgi:hypothetical protein